MVTAERAGVRRTRHTSHFKPYNGPLPDEPHDLSEIDEEEEERRDPQPELEQERRYPTLHVNDGVLIITSKGTADYDSLKAKGTILKMRK